MTSLSSPQKTTEVNSPESKIRLLIVDDQKMIREGLKALIQTEPDLEVVSIAHNGRDAIKQVLLHQPDIVLMDLEMPTLDGVSATKIICQKFPNVKVLILSTFDTPEYVARALSSGAMGYLLKGTPPRELINVIRSIHLGYAQIGPNVYQNLPLVNSKEKQIFLSSSATSNSNQSIVRQLSPRLNKQSNTAKKTDNSALTIAPKSNLTSRKFEQTVLLRPSPKWSRFTVWSVAGVTLFVIIWAAVAKIEQVVPATGQLKPEGSVKEVQIPTSGVIKEVFVEEGERVEKGETLLVLDSTTSEARLASLNNIRRSLTQENNFYHKLIGNKINAKGIDKAIAKTEIPREITFLTRDRAQLQEENELFNALLGVDSNNLTSQQQTILETYRLEMRSRTAAVRLEVEQLQKQLNQNRVQIADAKEQLATARQVLHQIELRNRDSQAQAQASLKIEEKALASLELLATEGAIPLVELDRQRQQVNDRRAESIEQQSRGKIEYDNQNQQVISTQSQIARLQEEERRIGLDIAQAREESINTTALSEKDTLNTIAANQQRIAEIDTRLNRSIVENEKRIQEIESEISSVEQTLKYQTIPAPVSGTIFDLEAYSGYVPPAGQAARPVLKIVPEDSLIAEVFIQPKDIGFVRKNMATDVRITAFPFGEYGDVKGKVAFIGKDALEPEPPYDFFRFRAEIELEEQFINIQGSDKRLQSGMTVQANIRIREHRTVLMLLFDRLLEGLRKFKEVG